MTKLSVNINKVALIRNARKGNLPNLVQFAMDCERFGAEGITVHPRPDERHVRYSDVPALKQVVKTELNVEGYPSERLMEMVLDVCPHQCTLVPDPPGVLTSDRGWEITKHRDFLTNIVKQLKEKNIRVSLFVNAALAEIEAAAAVGADRIEFYTGDYAHEFAAGKDAELHKHVACAQKAKELGLGINAGHDLNLDNLKNYAQTMPYLDEVSIGHALIADALYYGIANTIGLYQRCLR